MMRLSLLLRRPGRRRLATWPTAAPLSPAEVFGDGIAARKCAVLVPMRHGPPESLVLQSPAGDRQVAMTQPVIVGSAAATFAAPVAAVAPPRSTSPSTTSPSPSTPRISKPKPSPTPTKPKPTRPMPSRAVPRSGISLRTVRSLANLVCHDAEWRADVPHVACDPGHSPAASPPKQDRPQPQPQGCRARLRGAYECRPRPRVRARQSACRAS